MFKSFVIFFLFADYAKISNASVHFFNLKNDEIEIRSKSIEKKSDFIKALCAHIVIKGKYNFVLDTQDIVYDQKKALLNLRGKSTLKALLFILKTQHLDFNINSYDAFARSGVSVSYDKVKINSSEVFYQNESEILEFRKNVRVLFFE